MSEPHVGNKKKKKKLQRKRAKKRHAGKGPVPKGIAALAADEISRAARQQNRSVRPSP